MVSVYFNRSISVPLCIAVIAGIGVACAHLAANTINDYTDFDTTDKINRAAGPFNGGSRFLLGTSISRRFFLILSILFILPAIGIWLYFFVAAYYKAAMIAACAGFLAYSYSMPPLSLQKRGLGELGIVITSGPAISMGLQALFFGYVDLDGFLVGLGPGLLGSFILFVNQFPDHNADRAAGKKNLVVRLGTKIAVYFIFIYPALFFCTVSIHYMVFEYSLPAFLFSIVTGVFLFVLCCMANSTNRRGGSFEPLQKASILLHSFHTAGLVFVFLVN